MAILKSSNFYNLNRLKIKVLVKLGCMRGFWTKVLEIKIGLMKMELKQAYFSLYQKRYCFTLLYVLLKIRMRFFLIVHNMVWQANFLTDLQPQKLTSWPKKNI